MITCDIFFVFACFVLGSYRECFTTSILLGHPDYPIRPSPRLVLENFLNKNNPDFKTFYDDFAVFRDAYQPFY